MDAAGSLIEIWRAAAIDENQRRGAFNYDPLGVLARTGTLYYPAQRSCEIAAKFANDCRTMTNVTALLADGRPYHEAGASEAQELAAMLATLVAYLRACEGGGPEAALRLRQDRPGAGGRRRSVPDDRQAARRPQARRARRRGLRGHACGRPHASVGRHVGAHDGPARSLGEHAAHHDCLRRRRRSAAPTPSPCCPSPGRWAGPTPSPAASPATRTWCCRRRARSAASWTRRTAPGSSRR